MALIRLLKKSDRGNHMGNSFFKVKCVNTAFDPEDARNDPPRFSKPLQSARSNPGYAQCLCTRQNLRLQIREWSGTFRLAVWPQEGNIHNPRCFFFRDALAEEETAAARRVAIEEGDDGITNIKADFSLKRKVQSNTQTAQTLPTPNGPSTTRARAKLLTILRYLWQKSRLNRWDGRWTYLAYSVVHSELMYAADQCRISNLPLSEVLYMPPQFTKDVPQSQHEAARWRSFNQRLTASLSAKEVAAGLMLGEVKGIEPTQYGFRINLRHHQTSLYFSKQQFDAFSRRYEREWKAATNFSESHASGKPRVMVLAQVEAIKNYVTIIDAGFMLVSDAYIPVDSSYELALANGLVAQRRAFHKPFLAEARAGVVPDFVLLDTEPVVYMEVFGMATDEYLARKAEKIEKYRRAGKKLWQWNALEDKAWPQLHSKWVASDKPNA
jgi:hypothetical protein